MNESTKAFLTKMLQAFITKCEENDDGIELPTTEDGWCRLYAQYVLEYEDTAG